MRILFFIDTIGVGGVIRQLSLLTGGLRKRGHRVSVAALYPVDEDWSAMWEASHVPVKVLYESCPGKVISEAAGLVRATFELRRLIKKERIQILYAFQGHTAMFISWLASVSVPETRIVWSIQGSATDRPERYMERKSPAIYVNKRVSMFVPLIIANSEAGLIARRKSGYRCKKELVIYNGIDTDTFKPGNEARENVRREWGVPDGSPLVGIAARLSRVKGHSEFLKAASLLMKERLDVRFVCIGDGDPTYLNDLMLMSRQLGLDDRIIWVGYRPDMTSVLNALDILCSSSYSEGFSNTIGEAMACGVPCVVTDVGASARIVGDLGIVVPPSDPDALARGLARMLDKLPQIRTEELSGRIRDNFTVESMVGKTEKALNGLLRT